METLLQDVKFAIRTLRRRPGFAAVTIATLALGIGANTALFSVVRSVLLKPLPYAEPDRVVVVWSSWVGWERTWVSEPEFLDYRRDVESFEEVGAYTIGAGNLTGDGNPERVGLAAVSAGVFRVLGVDPLMGRVLSEDDDLPGRADLAVISHALWQRRFGGDPDVVGRTIELDGQVRTILGVMPPDFRLPEEYRAQVPTDVWVPIGIDAAAPGGRGAHYLFSVAHLRDGASLSTAQAEVDRLVAGWVEAGFVDPTADFRTVLVPADEEILGATRPTLWLLLGAVGLVLMIACANVANLLLGTSAARRREIAVRAAIGAGRRRIVRQLLSESLVLSAIGGLVGLLLAASTTSLIARVAPPGIPRIGEVGLDSGVLLFTLVLTVAAAAFFGMGPALLFSGGPLASGLTDGGRAGSAGPSRHFLRRALVVGEVALSLVLVIAAGLMLRTMAELYRIDLGFSTDGVLTMQASLPVADYPTPADVTSFLVELEERVEAVPGVRHAGATRLLPLTGTIGDWGIQLEGAENPEDGYQADWQVVTPGYLEAMSIRILRGRGLTDADRIDTTPVAVISERMARELWEGQDPIGRRYRIGGEEGPFFTVVGIAASVKHNRVTEDPRIEMYMPHQQFELVNGNPPRTMTLVVAAEGDPLALVAPIREQFRQLDPNLPPAQIRTLEQVADRALAQPRIAMVLLGAFALLALVLAAIGIYGVISQAVVERRRELAIRLALGAEAGSLLRMVLWDGLRLSVVGIAGGLLAAVALTRLMSALVYGVGTLDAATFIAVPVLLTLVAVLASGIPGWRASRLDPVEALNAE